MSGSDPAQARGESSEGRGDQVDTTLIGWEQVSAANLRALEVHAPIWASSIFLQGCELADIVTRRARWGEGERKSASAAISLFDEAVRSTMIRSEQIARAAEERLIFVRDFSEPYDLMVGNRQESEVFLRALGVMEPDSLSLLLALCQVAVRRMMGDRGARTWVDETYVPALPFVTYSACPFEWCQYDICYADTSTVARDSTSVESPVAFTIAEGQPLLAVTGIVIATALGEAPHACVDGARNPNGARVYLTCYLGEGFYEGYCEGTRVSVYAVECDMTLPELQWWVLMQDGEGRLGWVLDPEFTNLQSQDRRCVF